jgi:ketosteroid isomerase-like protein
MMNPAKSSPSHAPVAAPAAMGSVREQVIDWLERFASHVRDRHYEEARALFSHGVLGFGTWAYAVVGLASLEQQQWREIWQNSSGFRFDISELRVFGEGNQLCAAVPWSSVGYDATGAPFLRPGRATVVLAREGDRLLAVHTHFSLAPAISGKKSYPPPVVSE